MGQNQRGLDSKNQRDFDRLIDVEIALIDVFAILRVYWAGMRLFLREQPVHNSFYDL